MIKHILVPTDGSRCCEKALAKASKLAGDWGAKVTVLTVGEPLVELEPERTLVRRHNAFLKKQAKVIVKRAEKIFKSRGIKVNTVIKIGYPAEEIVKTAKRVKADVIVMGSRGMGIRKILLGSVSREVAEKATRPVLIVR